MAAMWAVNGDEKNLKTPEQKQFSGWAKDLLQECDLWFKVFPTTYFTATKKVFYALFLMTTGTAKVWKDAFINEWKGQNDLCPGNDWTQFKTLLKESFADPGQSKDAMQQLQMICQGKKSIDTMNTRFCLLLSKAGINVTHNVPLLIQLYEKAINPNIYCQIILNGTVPDTFNAYMLRASTVDRAFKMTNIKSAFTSYQGRKVPFQIATIIKFSRRTNGCQCDFHKSIWQEVFQLRKAWTLCERVSSVKGEEMFQLWKTQTLHE